jgi:methyltransferase (TIGR00027 family)
MREGHASATAEHNALFRALDAFRPPATHLIDDPFAGGFLSFPLSLVHRLARFPGIRTLVPWFIDRRWPGVRTAVVARTRLIDDTIARLLGEGVEQFVVLGAGFDSRAWRIPALRGVDVFEVDHPATQAAKREALARALDAQPAHVRFVAVDFARDDLASRMDAAGYLESRRTLFLWEGTTNYLTEPAVDATLRWCARARPGSVLLFTYVHRDIITNPASFAGSERLFASLERFGERFTFGIHPDELAAFLAKRGLSLESDVSCPEFRARYYGDAAREMRGHEFYRVAVARVSGGQRLG